MKKKIVVGFLCSMLLIPTSFSFAQKSTPPICSTPSSTMILYQEFQNKMMSVLLGGNYAEKIFQSNIDVTGLFANQVLLLPVTNALNVAFSSLDTTLQRLGGASVTLGVLLTLASASVVSSNLEGFVILFQDRAIVRDYRTLLQIETKLSQIAFQLSKRVRLTAELDNILPVLQTIVQEYQDKGLFIEFSKSGTATYLSIFMDLISMNAAMKVFISSEGTGPLYNYEAGILGIKFNPEEISTLEKDYAEVRGFSVCSAAFSKMKDGVQGAGQSQAAAAKDAGATIVRASKKLGEAMTKTFTPKNKKSLAEEYFTSLELQQLRTVYGINTSRMTREDAIMWLDVINTPANFKKLGKQIGSKAKSIFESVKKDTSRIIETAEEYVDYLKAKYPGLKEGNSRATYKRIQEERQNNKDKKSLSFSHNERAYEFSLLGVTYNSDFSDSLKQDINQSLTDIKKLQKERFDSLMVADNVTDLPLFYTLVQYLQNIEKQIGDRNSGLLKTVKEVCEMQCANKGTAGCG